MEDVVVAAAHCVYFQSENRWAFANELYMLQGDFATPDGWSLKYLPCVDFDAHADYDSKRAAGLSDEALIKLDPGMFKQILIENILL